MKTRMVRSFKLGLIFMLLSLIANTFDFRISGITDGWTWAGVFALVLIADRLFCVAFDYWVGVEVEDK